MAMPLMNQNNPMMNQSNPIMNLDQWYAHAKSLPKNMQPGQQGVGAALAAMRKKNRPQQPKAIPGRAVTQTVPYGGAAPSAPTIRV